ncbi:hypothetical protein PUN28_004248 [Cardiocondyla obscurior]|uniref:Uncharacterized protein n=1 Tax=Cardiocondyla obscurior TaxID=286306 RepID=A0AAW2GCB5_9HYME
MRLLYLSLIFVIVFIMTFYESKTKASSEADAMSEADPRRKLLKLIKNLFYLFL